MTRHWIDGTIAVLLFVGAAIGGMSYWKGAVATGQPFYYQIYFEPAVMIGCGKGFVVARPQVPAMVPFLLRQVDRFSCDAIAADAPLGTDDMFQLGSWRYLMLAVGYPWRLFGVSWSALGPLFAVLFGATTASHTASSAWHESSSGGHWRVGAEAFRRALVVFPVLRDYTKAPFTLLLIFLLGLLVKRRDMERPCRLPPRRSSGVRYGWLISSDIPPFFVTLFAFLDGGILRNIRLKLAASAVCAAMFTVIAAGPLLVGQIPLGCGWHVVLLGFARPFSDSLGVEGAPTT
jgi:hypothetical protein